MKTLIEIEAEVNRLAATIGAAGHVSLPTYGHSEDTARPHVEVDSRGYHFVVVERGDELSRFTTRDLDDLLYRVFEGFTSDLAVFHEVAHRVDAQDPRRIGFQRQVELLSRLLPRWGERRAQEHEGILRQHPFDDLAVVRALLMRELRQAGHSPEAAWQAACERYPLLGPA